MNILEPNDYSRITLFIFCDELHSHSDASADSQHHAYVSVTTLTCLVLAIDAPRTNTSHIVADPLPIEKFQRLLRRLYAW